MLSLSLQFFVFKRILIKQFSAHNHSGSICKDDFGYDIWIRKNFNQIIIFQDLSSVYKKKNVDQWEKIKGKKEDESPTQPKFEKF